MNIKQIETFYWAVKLGSFKAAASYLNATQSTVSTRIQELEEFFGIDLFDRTRRAAKLTTKGVELFNYAERFVKLAEEMQACISQPDSISGSVRVGVSEIIAGTWLPKLIRAVRGRYPKLAVEYEVTPVANQLEKLRRGDLDLLLLPRQKSHYGHQVHSLGCVPFKWLASPDFVLPAQPPLTAADFIDIPVATLTKGSNNWHAIETWLNENGGFCKRITECNTMDVICALTIAGQGLGLFQLCSYQKELSEGSLVIVETFPDIPLVEFGAVTNDDHLRLPVRIVADLAAELSEFAQRGE